jgi:myo-inositol-1(or 4)-monophosphatase
MFSEYRQVAEQAARAAGQVQIEGLSKTRNIDYKSAFNLVTDIDVACEAKIIEIISQRYPNDQILAEEGSSNPKGSGRRWIIDPLDGTTNYAHRYPFFAVSIGVEEAGKIVAGVVYNVVSNELFHAELGSGAYLNNRQIKVSSIPALEKSLLATGFPYDSAKAGDNNMLRFRTLTDLCHGVRRDGAAALDLCYVAVGRLDGFWEVGLSPWDMAAGSLIVTEAGGTVTDLYGEVLDMQTGRMLASNGFVHKELISVLMRTDNIAVA